MIIKLLLWEDSEPYITIKLHEGYKMSCNIIKNFVVRKNKLQHLLFVMISVFSLVFSASSKAAVLRSGIYGGLGAIHQIANYSFTRHFTGIRSNDSPEFTHQTNTDNSNMMPQFLLGYQYITGPWYLGADYSLILHATTVRGYQGIYVNPDGYPITLSRYDHYSTLQVTNPQSVNLLFGRLISSAVAVYLRLGVEDAQFENNFVNYVVDVGYLNIPTRMESNRTSFHRAAGQIGVGAVYQFNSHWMVRVDYRYTNYGQMHYNKYIVDANGPHNSYKTFSYRTQSFGISFNCLFG